MPSLRNASHWILRNRIQNGCNFYCSAELTDISINRGTPVLADATCQCRYGTQGTRAGFHPDRFSERRNDATLDRGGQRALRIIEMVELVHTIYGFSINSSNCSCVASELARPTAMFVPETNTNLIGAITSAQADGPVRRSQDSVPGQSVDSPVDGETSASNTH
jgi:hypothetical protein